MVDDSAALALQNQGILNQQFSQAFSPLNNYAAQNLQLGIAQQRMRQEQAQRVYEMQLANQFQKQREADQYDYNRRLAAQAESASMAQTQFVQSAEAKRQEAATRLNFQLTDQKEKDKEANALRENPDVKRILGASALNKFPDSPEGNNALIAAWHQKSADPDVQENLAATKAETLAKQIKGVIGGMTAVVPGSPQAKQAVMAFLAQPGVTDLLLKKGDLTPGDIQAIQAGGDPSKVMRAIQQVDDNAVFPWSANSRVSTLLSAWNQALLQSNAVPSAEQAAKMNYLQDLMGKMKDVMPNLTTEASYQRVAKAYGIAPSEVKLPPPTAPAPSPASLRPNAGQPNPFGTPNTTVQNPTVGIGGLLGLDASPADLAATNAYKMSARVGNLQAAFAPVRYAADPATEYAIRQKLLDSHRQSGAALEGLKEGVLFQSPQPYYDAYKQTQDEKALQGVVRDVFSNQVPPGTQQLIPNNAVNPVPPQYNNPMTLPPQYNAPAQSAPWRPF